MFSNCSGLTSIVIDNIDTSKVTDMSYMFYCCSSLSDVYFYGRKSLDTSNVTTMKYMFGKCTNLKGVYMHGYLSKVTSMDYMFSNCTSLLKVIMFMPDAIESYTDMFANITTTGTLYLRFDDDTMTESPLSWLSIIPITWNLEITDIDEAIPENY
jgi:surface protein